MHQRSLGQAQGDLPSMPLSATSTRCPARSHGFFKVPTDTRRSHKQPISGKSNVASFCTEPILSNGEGKENLKRKRGLQMRSIHNVGKKLLLESGKTLEQPQPQDQGTVADLDKDLLNQICDLSITRACEQPQPVLASSTQEPKTTECQPFLLRSDVRAQTRVQETEQVAKFESFANRMGRILLRDTGGLEEPKPALRRVDSMPAFKRSFDSSFEQTNSSGLNATHASFKALPLNRRILAQPDVLPVVKKKEQTKPVAFSLSLSNKKSFPDSEMPVTPKRNKTDHETTALAPFQLLTAARAAARSIPNNEEQLNTQQSFKARSVPEYHFFTPKLESRKTQIQGTHNCSQT